MLCSVPFWPACWLFVVVFVAATNRGGLPHPAPSTSTRLTFHPSFSYFNSLLAGVVFVAATNRADLLDPALMRAGRFDRKIRILRPNEQGRTEILRVRLSAWLLRQYTGWGGARRLAWFTKH